MDVSDTNSVSEVIRGHTNYSIPELIIKKRDGGKLTKDELEYFVNGVVNGTTQDAQLGAMLMVMSIRGLDNKETTCLTRAMTNSGDVLSWPQEWQGSIVDKHSTGGVGDKVSLVLAPALAACGVKVPMMSGRGLAHTGGTLDKLESISGFTVSQSQDQMRTALDTIGCCIFGQTSNLVPADKIMYATRDVTGTVDSIGLIAASIISKKAAEKLDVLVLDVKVGQGAFCKTETEARELATRMVDAGKGCGMRTLALLTTMDTPLGRMIGNSLEVAESIACLHGDSAGADDVVELTVMLGGELLHNCGKAADLAEASQMIRDSLHDGSAIAKFCAMLKSQGVSSELADKLCAKGTDVMTVLPRAKHVTDIKSPGTGYVHHIDAMNCAIVSFKLGAGRTKTGDPINFGVGLELCTSVGQAIDKDATWVRVHHDEPAVPTKLEEILEKSVKIDTKPLQRQTTRVVDIIT